MVFSFRKAMSDSYILIIVGAVIVLVGMSFFLGNISNKVGKADAVLLGDDDDDTTTTTTPCDPIPCGVNTCDCRTQFCGYPGIVGQCCNNDQTACNVYCCNSDQECRRDYVCCGQGYVDCDPHVSGGCCPTAAQCIVSEMGGGCCGDGEIFVGDIEARIGACCGQTPSGEQRQACCTSDGRTYCTDNYGQCQYSSDNPEEHDPLC